MKKTPNREFLGLKEQALHYGICGLSLKLFHLAKSSAGKCENFAIVLVMKDSGKLELPKLISDGLLYLFSFSFLPFSVLPLLFDNACLPDYFDP